MSTILMIGTFDTKQQEFAYLRNRIEQRGHEVLAVDVGVMGAEHGAIEAQIEAGEVALAAGSDLQVLREEKNRDHAMDAMCRGAEIVVRRLFDEGRFHGLIGMGGGGGTSIVTSAMRALPIGIPKVCVSTVASGDVSGYVGIKDIVMMPSLVDIAGLNSISRILIAQAAGAICGMVETVGAPVMLKEKPLIAATMFGNTTKCVQRCAERLREQGFELLIFHATGAGGKMMEQLILEGYVDAVLDLTTTEIADELCGGMMSAGAERLKAAALMGIPQVVAPGCLDMVNFGPRDTVPLSYVNAGRLLYAWNPNNTLMRTGKDDNVLIGRQIALRLNAAKGPVKMLFPLNGLSILDEDGQPFCDRDADSALLTAMQERLRPDIEIIEVAAAINDAEFADTAVDVLLDLIDQQRKGVWAHDTSH